MNDKKFVDFGERIIAQAAAAGEHAFSYVPNKPEVLEARPLSAKEREVGRLSSIDREYAPPSVLRKAR